MYLVELEGNKGIDILLAVKQGLQMELSVDFLRVKNTCHN